MKGKLLILKVRANKVNGQKQITIPKDVEDIKEGDYVKVEKVKIK